MKALLSAGTDTSSGTTEWAMSLLLNNPQVLKTAVAEFEAKLGHNCLPEETDLSNLPYFERNHHRNQCSSPTNHQKIAPHESSEDCTVGSFSIPSGTMLMVDVWVIQRDPKIWDDPVAFRTERFLNQEGNVDKDKTTMMMPFGLGRRRCPGEELASRVIGLMLGTLIQCFEWERIGDELVEMSEGTGLTLPKAKPLEALYKPRRAMVNVLSNL